MVAGFTLSAEDLQTFADQVMRRRSTLKIDSALRNNRLDGSELPGSAALTLVQLAGVEAMGDRFRRLSNGLGAIGWLADECAKQFPALDGTSADGIAAALPRMPTANVLPGIDRRFAAAKAPPWIDPLTPLESGRVVVDGDVISRDLSWEVPFSDLWAWIKTDHEDIDRIDTAVDYWRQAYKLLHNNAEWLRLKIKVVQDAFDGGETARVLGQHLLEWADAVDTLARRTANNTRVFKDAIAEIRLDYGRMAKIRRDLYPHLAAIERSLRENQLTSGITEVLSSNPLVQMTAQAGGWMRDRAAQLRALPVMNELNNKLGDAARAIHRSYAADQSAWWEHAPQAAPSLELDRPR